MTFLVPYDGSSLSMAALVRASEFAETFDEPVVSVTVLPRDNWSYAFDRGWVEFDEEYDLERVVDRLREEALGVAPDAEFRYEVVASTLPRTVAVAIREVAAELNPSIVFVGSENAGDVVAPVSSVGSEVAADAEYDVHIVRHWSPSRIDTVETRPELYPADGSRPSGSRDESE